MSVRIFDSYPTVNGKKNSWIKVISLAHIAGEIMYSLYIEKWNKRSGTL